MNDHKNDNSNNSALISFMKKIGNTISKLYTKILTRISGQVTEINMQNDTDYYETGKQIVPELIEPNEGEITLKQYDLAILRSRAKFTKAKGKLQITNKRLLFRATGRSPAGKTVYQQEYSMDKIDGIEIKKDFRFRGLDLLLCLWMNSTLVGIGVGFASIINSGFGVFLAILDLLLAVATCIPFFMLRKRYFLKQLLSCIGMGISFSALFVGIKESSAFLVVFAILITILVFAIYVVSVFMFCLKPNLRIEIKTGGMPAIQVRHKYTSLFIWHKMDEYSGFAEVLPDKDADLAIKELGTIINDIKTLGDFGVEKWKNTTSTGKEDIQ